MNDLNGALQQRLDLLATLAPLMGRVEAIAKRFQATLDRGGKVVWMGNGGSASHAQHMASEFVGRFARERRGIPALSLTADTAVLTAVSNDYGYERVFARQVEALCTASDVVVGFSTSGTSPNVVEGLRAGRALGAYTLALTGARGRALSELCDECIVVPSTDAACLQEAHLVLVHLICLAMESDAKRAER